MLLLSVADSLSMAGALGGFLLGATLILMCVYNPNKNEDKEYFFRRKSTVFFR